MLMELLDLRIEADVEVPQTCVLSDGQQGATTLVSKLRVNVYEKMTLDLTLLITAVNHFLMRL